MNHKYKARGEKVAGTWFASQFEKAVYYELCLRVRGGEYLSLQCQDTVELTDAKIVYKPDFRLTNLDGSFTWVEAKGYETPEWRIKKKLWKVYGPGPLIIYKGTSKSYKTETIIPKDLKK